MDKALKKLNEEKNTINCDIDMIRHSTVKLLMIMMIMIGWKYDNLNFQSQKYHDDKSLT